MDHPLHARFDLQRDLGASPLGRRWRACDRATGSDVLVVVARAHERLALRQRADAQARLCHPHLAATLHQGEAENAGAYAAFEWLTPADELMPTPEQLRAWLPGWLQALAHLHDAGWVHGGLSPDGLGLAADGTAKLADLGRRWRIGQAASSDGSRREWAAPEVLAEARVDGRTDLYMLGALVMRLGGGEDGAWLDWPAPWPALLEGLTAEHPRDRIGSAAEALATLTTGVSARAPRLATPFVGRQQELDQLVALADALSEEPQVQAVVVHGEAGIGKSRLLEEFRQRLCARGFAVVSARAGLRADAGPYSAWAAPVPQLLKRVSPAVREAVMPLLASVIPGLGPACAEPLEPRAERMRLYRAFATLLEEATPDAGLGLFFDDWHLADAASGELLDHLIKTLPAMPLCVVLAGREAPQDGLPGLPIGHFGAGEVQALLRNLWPRSGPDGGAAVLEAATGGHPALVEEAVLECVGALAAGTPADKALRAQLATPRSLTAMWQQRLVGRSHAARAVASAATVAGARASLPLLRAVSGLEEGALLEAVEELQEAGLLASDARGYTLLAPAEAVDDGLDATGHARALGYWQVAAQLGAAVPASLLAHHAIAAGDARSAAHYCMAAARAAHRVFALAEAGRLLEATEACLERLAEVPVAWLLELAASQGDQARYHGRGAEAEGHYRRALGLAAEVAPERRPELLISLGIALGLQSRSAEAIACYQETLALPETPESARGRALAALARLHVRLGDTETATARLEEALTLSGLPSLYRGEALGLLGLVLTTSATPRIEAGLGYLDEAERLAESTGDRLALVNATMLAGNARMGLGRLQEARRSFERYAVLCLELGLADERACAILNLAQVAYEEGRYQEAWQQARWGTECAAASGNRIYEAFGKAYIGLAGCHLGFLGEAEQALRESAELAFKVGSDHLSVQVMLARLEALIFLGRLGQAEELGNDLHQRQEAAGLHEFAGLHSLLMGQLYELAGEVPTAMPYLQRARQAGEATGSQTVLAGVALALSRLALQSGQLGVAQARALDALAGGEHTGAHLVQLRAHLLLARVNHQLGFPEATQAHLTSASELASELASPHWQAMVWQQCARLLEDESALRGKAATFLQFYLQQLPPRARQEFMNWPDRREIMAPRATGPLNAPPFGVPPAARPEPAERTLRIPQAAAPSHEDRGGESSCAPA